VVEKAGKKNNYLHSNYINSIRAWLVQHFRQLLDKEGIWPVLPIKQQNSEAVQLEAS